MAIFPADRNILPRMTHQNFNKSKFGIPVHNKYEQHYSSSNIDNIKYDIDRFQRICAKNPDNVQAKKLLNMFQDLLSSIENAVK